MTAIALPLLLVLLQAPAPPDPVVTARQQILAGNCPSAVETLTMQLHSGAKVGDAPYQLLAFCYERSGEMNQAMETLRDGLRGNPDSQALKRTLGELLFRQNPANPQAGQLLADAVKADPKDPEARHYYAQWASLNNREQICADQEQAAVRLAGLNALALLQMYTLQGMCLNHLDQSAAAQTAFEKAFAINLKQQPFNPSMAYQYIQFLSGRGDTEREQSVVDETLKRSPRFGPAHLERAKYFDHQRQPEKAVEEATAALQGEGDEDTNIRAAHALLAKSYFILGKTQEAETEQKWVESHANATQP
jgi:tetratricopeptide (TPR) repeat protein